MLSRRVTCSSHLQGLHLEAFLIIELNLDGDLRGHGIQKGQGAIPQHVGDKIGFRTEVDLSYHILTFLGLDLS